MSLLNVPRDDTSATFRTLNKLLNRASGDDARRSLSAGAVLWGVVRREGLSDLDDPSAHAGLAQHAYLVDRDEQAMCGYRPPRRRNLFGSEPRVELAVASPLYNPACRRCAAAVGVPGDAVDDVMTAFETPVEVSRLTPPTRMNDEPLTAAVWAPVATYTRDEPAVAVPDLATVVELPTLRLGGVVTVAPGSDSLTLRGKEIRAGTAIVANLEGAPRGLRVVSVAVHGRGSASVVLNRRVKRPVQVAWFLASPSGGDTRQRSSRAA